MTDDRDDMITIRATISAADAEKIQQASDEGRAVTVTAKVMLSEETISGISTIMEAPGDMDMVELLKLVDMNPAKGLRHSDLSGTSWGAHDLAGYDLTGCNLTGCDFSQAKVEGMIYDGATIDGVTWPAGYAPTVRYDA